MSIFRRKIRNIPWRSQSDLRWRPPPSATAITEFTQQKSTKTKKALLSSSDFNDDDIYGAALSAVTEQHYGEAQIFSRGYDSGNKNLVDWDFLVLYALDDGRFLCIKILNYDMEE